MSSVNLRPLLIVFLIFLLALFIRSYFGYDMTASNDWIVSGGSDSYYYQRLMIHGVETGEHLHWDPMLNFPDGARNPRPPFYTFSVAVPAVAFQGFFSGAEDSMGFFLIWSTAFWGALTIVPTYLIGRELFGRKTGYIAALFLAILPSHVERSVVSLADHDPFVLFLIVLTVYFLMRALKTSNNSKWVDNWLHFRSILPGLKLFSSHNRTAIIYSLLAGLSFAGIAIAWVGFSYVEVIILSFFLLQVLINKFKGIDSTTITLLFLIMFGFAFLLIFPVYYQMWIFSVRFDVPFYLFLASIIFGFLFIVTRDLPWLIVIPTLSVLIGIAFVMVMIINPSLGEAIFTGQGYFFQSKLYETIAEARAPHFSELGVSFGMATFVLSFIGLMLMLSKIPKRTSGDFIIVSIWMAIAIFMAASAGRFMFNAAPAFALTSAWVTVIIINKLEFNKIGKLFSGSSGTLYQVVRKSVKVRHVIGALFIVFMLIFPNAWMALDAGIPHEKKSEIDQEIYAALPSFLKPDEYTGGNWYLGAFGYSLPLPTQYFPAYWDWFEEQDSDILPQSSRPAYVSWWDYGFEAIEEGNHPSVADNFQQGYQIAGDILLAQSEEETIGLFISRIVNADITDNGGEMTSELSEILEDNGASSSEVLDIIKNPMNYRDAVISNPEKYGSAMSDISSLNVMWRYLGIYFADLGMDNAVALYHDLRDYTGFCIGYLGVDSRLIQKTATDGSVFYAPVKLTDRTIDGSNNPSDYYVIKAVDDQGFEYDLNDEALSTARIVDYRLYYQEAFFKTMIYRAFAGIAPSDLGQPNDGLPGFSGSVQSEAIAPGWNLTHFMMVYQTAYYNPAPDASAPWQAVSLDEAIAHNIAIQNGDEEGFVDTRPSNLYQVGATMLKYYDGAVMSGTVLDSQGAPAPGVRVTVHDRHFIPHHSVLTDSSGEYSLILPPGNDTIILSSGERDPRTLVGADVLDKFNMNISDEQAMREDIDLDGDGVYDWQIKTDFTVPSSTIRGTAFWDNDRDGNFTQGTDSLILAGAVSVRNIDTGFSYPAQITNGAFNIVVSPGRYELDTLINDILTEAEYNFALGPGDNFQSNVPRYPTSIHGIVVNSDGSPASQVAVTISSISESFAFNNTSVFTNSTGEYIFEYLLPGEYTLKTNTTVQSAFSRAVKTSLSEPDKMANFVLKLTGEIDISVIDQYGQGLQNASVKVANSYAPTESAIFFTDSTGKADLRIPNGQYSITVRIPTGNEVLVGGVSAKVPALGSTSTTIVATPATLVQGTINAQIKPGVFAPEPESHVAFYFGLVSYLTFTNDSGRFSTYLPEGDYEAASYSFNSDQIGGMIISVPAENAVNINMKAASNISGTVWHDRNTNGIRDSNEIVPNAFIRVALSNGVTLRGLSDLIGNYTIFVPKDETMTIMAGGIGYDLTAGDTLVSSSDEITRLIEVDLSPISISGRMLIDGQPLRGVNVSFINGTNEVIFTSDLDGLFSGSLLPAIYQLHIEEPIIPGGMEYYYYNFVTIVFVGVDIPNIDILVERRMKVSGTISGKSPGDTVRLFFNSASPTASNEELETDEDEFDVYLKEGDYISYGYDWPDSNRADLFKFNVSPDNLTIAVHLDNAYKVSGQIDFGSQQQGNTTFMEILDVYSGANLSLDIPPNVVYSIALPSSTYEFSSVLKYLDEDPRRGRFLFLTNTSTIVLDSDTEFTPFFTYGLENSSLSISVTDKWGNPMQTQVQLLPENKFAAEETFNSDANGKIESSIHPGFYGVYVSDTSKGLSYFGSLGVAHIEPAFLNITLGTAYRVTVVATAQNSGSIQTFSLQIVGNDAGGTLDIPMQEYTNTLSFILPAGNYTIALDASRVENNKAVLYKATVETEIISDTILNVPLNREDTYTFEIDWDPADKKSILPGENVTYFIELTNTGNSKDSYSMSGTGTGFDYSFPEVVTANYGSMGNIVSVPVKITSSEDSKVAHDELKVEFVSEGDPSFKREVPIELGILPIYSMKTEADATGQINGTSYFGNIKITNTGNDMDNFTFYLSNLYELLINGWDVSFLSSTGLESRTSDLNPGDSENINLTFISTRQNPNAKVAAYVTIVSNSSNAVISVASISPILPDLEFDVKEQLDIDGDNMFLNDIFSEKNQQNLVLLLALLILIAAIFVVRKIKFGRFLR